jgi:mRNA-degrading endonuclease RelE of RelBE toxin-antitoxin system
MSDSAKKWQVIITRQAERRMKRLAEAIHKAFASWLLNLLADDPRPSGYKKMVEHDDLYRIRVGIGVLSMPLRMIACLS